MIFLFVLNSNLAPVFISVLWVSYIEGHILRLPCKEVGEFTITKDNFELQGSVVATFTNLQDFECEDKCRLNPKCKSINMEKEGSKSCQLNSVSTGEKIPGGNALVAKTGWVYKTTDYNSTLIGENCQLLKPCPFYQVCRDLCSCQGYECLTPKDCMDIQKRNATTNSVYGILPDASPTMPMQVFCDMQTDGGGWIVFQRRVDGTVDFNRNWAEYKNGFGEMHGNFWLGLEKLHVLAAPGRKAVLRVDLKHREVANKVYAYYSTFVIGSKSDGYRLKIGGYSGNSGDSLAFHNGMKFTTPDRDNDKFVDGNCAVYYKSGWWFKDCYRANLNNPYPTSPTGTGNDWYMSWHKIKYQYGNIVFSEMKLRYAL